MLIFRHEMERKLSYNLVVSEDGAGHPTSARDASEVADLEDVGETLQTTAGPGVLVKIIDQEAHGEYMTPTCEY
jgi:hypothetical protein